MQVRKSDMSTYFEDLAAVRPTQMNIIPRLANMMYDKMIMQLEHTPDGDEHDKVAYKQACAALQQASNVNHSVLRALATTP